MDKETAFWDRVSRSDGCWNWEGPADRHGYARVSWENRNALASRVAYVIANGEIPDGAHICHTCDNRLCVRPDHLYAGDHSTNMQDKVDRGRNRNQYEQATACVNGHGFTEVNTYVKPDGRRQCRTCAKERSERFREKKAS